jgi:hypothetical protein
MLCLSISQFDPYLTSMTELNIDGLDSLRGTVLIPPTSPQPARSCARLHCSRNTVLPIFNALQRAGVKRQNKEPHMPWLANTFWQLLLSRVLFCCKHC